MPEFSFHSAQDQSIDNGEAGDRKLLSIDTHHAKSMFSQVCASLRVTSAADLCGPVGDVSWRAKYRGMANSGAAGLPGPFRQCLSEISECLRITSQTSFFRPSPNSVNQTGLNRNKLILNLAMNHSIDDCFRFGQLLGVAARSKNCLDLDLSDIFWRLLLGYQLSLDDLVSFDYTSWAFFRFRDPTDQHLYDESEFYQLYPDLCWVITLTDTKTQQELRPQGKTLPVAFADRHKFGRLAAAARFNECVLQLNAIRQGLQTLLPPKSLPLLTWQELELRVCGEPDFNIEWLKKRSLYAPKKFTDDSPVIKNFWSTLAAFSAENRRQFLQFAWARSRLPPESDPNATWRMRININESASQNDLPSAETCFFNVNIPHYQTLEQMSQKLLMSITHCSSITS
jgi:E3 ubiquitin-protein ligase HERC2